MRNIKYVINQIKGIAITTLKYKVIPIIIVMLSSLSLVILNPQSQETMKSLWIY